MTLITHGILKLGSVIENKLWEKGYTESNIADEAFEKLKKIEGKIGRYGDPLALAKKVLEVPAVLVFSPVYGVVRIVEKVEKKKEKKEKAEKAEKEKLAKLQAELDLKRETSVLTEIIKESSLIVSRDANKDDINAFHADLLNPDETTKDKIINIDENHVAFVYDFGDKQEMNVFFINPETGNKEQIAQITSKDGIKAIKMAISKRKAELKTNQDKMSKLRIKNAAIKEKINGANAK